MPVIEGASCLHDFLGNNESRIYPRIYLIIGSALALQLLTIPRLPVIAQISNFRLSACSDNLRRSALGWREGSINITSPVPVQLRKKKTHPKTILTELYMQSSEDFLLFHILTVR